MPYTSSASKAPSWTPWCNGQTWDEPQFLPLFKAAEAMGAVLFFHPQPQDNLLLPRTEQLWPGQ